MVIIKQWSCILLLGFGYRAVATELMQRTEILYQFQLPGMTWQLTIITLLASLIISFFIPKTLRRPSDGFVLVYAVAVVIPKIFLVSTFQQLFFADMLIIISLLISPIIVIWVLSRVTFPLSGFGIRGHTASGRASLLYAIFGISFLLILLEFRHSLDLDFGAHYDRRFAFRELGGSVAFGYFYNFFALALTPFITYAAMRDKKYVVLGLTILASILVFSTSGEKFPFLMVIVSLGFSVIVSMERPPSTSRIILLMSGVNILALVEVFILGGTLWGDYFFRRFIVVPVNNIELYYDFMLRFAGDFWSGIEEKRATFIIGDHYFPGQETNLNVNFVFVELAINGLIGVVVAATFLGFWLKLIDVAYQNTRDLNFFVVPFLMALLGYEQRIYSVFLSSGICLLLVLICISQMSRHLSLNLPRFPGSS